MTKTYNQVESFENAEEIWKPNESDVCHSIIEMARMPDFEADTSKQCNASNLQEAKESCDTEDCSQDGNSSSDMDEREKQTKLLKF